ncbi:unnamed protein product [Caenorhabditis bovis]|uniref:VWFA domain-containing protein n=1 Tax=Caenorhabditis bovis TaxID=2654633 RepID=A0A8S1EBY8_9PELO|nr:unnamed protein product [Caenorhabditis bovis]
MMRIEFLLSLLVASCAAIDDPECPCIFNNLWLDMVFLIDDSTLMQQTGLFEIGSSINSLFGYSNIRIGTGYADPRSTRVGVITYNEDTTIVADLDAFHSKDELVDTVMHLKLSDSDKSDLTKALKEASSLLLTTKRENFQPVIVVFASAYRQYNGEDLKATADKIKQQGIKLIVVSYVERNADLSIEKLADLASPGGFAFDNFNPNIDIPDVIRISLCRMNCFCTESWTQYSETFGDSASHQFATCVKVLDVPLAWAPASIECQNVAYRGYLTNEYNQKKHDFNYNLFKNYTAKGPYSYHIGLSFSNGEYVWAQPQGFSKIKLDNQLYPLSNNPGDQGSVYNKQDDGTDSTSLMDNFGTEQISWTGNAVNNKPENNIAPNKKKTPSQRTTDYIMHS